MQSHHNWTCCALHGQVSQRHMKWYLIHWLWFLFISCVMVKRGCSSDVAYFSPRHWFIFQEHKTLALRREGTGVVLDSLTMIFIRPFEKRDVLCRGNVRPSVRLSVRPSVRPSVRIFRTFLQHALRYQFETWYMHSVGGTTCRVWVASQLSQFDLVYSQK